MTHRLVENAKALETALKGAARAEIDKGAYEQAEVLLGLVKEAGSLTGRLERLGAAPTTATYAGNVGGSPGRAHARFHFTESRLVMDAQRREDRTEKYRQRVPLDRVETILGYVRALGANGQVFSHGQILDRYGRANPAYHVYIVTRLLRENGVMKEDGRGAYRIEAGGLEDLSVEALRRLVA